MLCYSAVYGQDIIAEFDFDNCVVEDKRGNYTDNFIRDNIECGCGVIDNSDALIFDGSADTIFLDPDIKDIFLNDFSMSFYFWVEDAVEEYPLFAIQNECSFDSSFQIRYAPFAKELQVEFSQNFNDGVFFRAQIDDRKCWHHFLLTRLESVFTLYIDGEFIVTFDEGLELGLGDNHNVTVGYSPCIDPSQPNSDLYFRGRMDNLTFYDGAIVQEEEIQSLLFFPDEIITADTTIFQGDQIDIITGLSCSSNVTWTPSLGLSDPNSSSTMAFPEETTTYDVVFDHGTCASMDNITISVIKPDDLECDNILLPNAFTPNSDGLNDMFFISNNFIIENLNRFEIYDKWGMKLFSTINKNESWNGSYNGVPMPPATYIYKIEYSCQGTVYQKTGSFNILK